jgi:hypothetical protein
MLKETKIYRYVVSEALGKRADQLPDFSKQIKKEAQDLGILSSRFPLHTGEMSVHITRSPSPHTPKRSVETSAPHNQEHTAPHYIFWYWLHGQDGAEPASISDLALSQNDRSNIAEYLALSQEQLFRAVPESLSFSLYGATGHVDKDQQLKNGTGRGSQSNRFAHHHSVDLRIPQSEVYQRALDPSDSEKFPTQTRQLLKNIAPRNQQWSESFGQPVSNWLTQQKWSFAPKIHFSRSPKELPHTTTNQPLIPLFVPMGIQLMPPEGQSWTLQQAFQTLLEAYAYVTQAYDTCVREYYEYWNLDGEQQIVVSKNQDKNYPFQSLRMSEIFDPQALVAIRKLIGKTHPTLEQILRSTHPRKDALEAVYNELKNGRFHNLFDNFSTHVLQELLYKKTPIEFVMSELLSSVWSFGLTQHGTIDRITISPCLGTSKSGFEHLTGMAVER